MIMNNTKTTFLMKSRYRVFVDALNEFLERERERERERESYLGKINPIYQKTARIAEDPQIQMWNLAKSGL